MNFNPLVDSASLFGFILLRQSINSRHWLRFSAIAFMLALLGACAGLPPISSELVSAQRTFQATLEISGRLSVRYELNNNPEALHGSFNWMQQSQQTTLTLRSPLGQTLAQIEVTPTRATLQQSGQAPRSAADADTLAAEVFGWPLPVAGLRDWLQGYVWQRGQRIDAALQLDADYLQDGWRIRFGQWQPAGAVLAHPTRIDLTRETSAAGTVAIRIVIDRWQPP